MVPFLDIASLINEQDPELDFFQNVTHVQLHRRARALRRVSAALSGERKTQWVPTQASIVHILLPLALHPIYEASKGSQLDTLLPDSLAALEALAKRLPWSYFAQLLRQVR